MPIDQRLSAFEAISLTATDDSVSYEERYTLFRCRPSNSKMFWLDGIASVDARRLHFSVMQEAADAAAAGFGISRILPIPKEPGLNSYGELASESRKNVALDIETERQLLEAQRVIVSAIFDPNTELTAHGQRGTYGEPASLDALPEQIPGHIFANRTHTLTYNGWVSINPRGASLTKLKSQPFCWGNVWFYRYQIEAIIELLRQHNRQQDNVIASDRTGGQGRPTSGHLVHAEFARRQEIGEVCAKLVDEAQILCLF
jgi:hypothetical protein